MRIAIVAALVVAGCSSGGGGSSAGGGAAEPIKAYAPTREGLAELWGDILKAAQKDDRARVHDLLASMVMTQDDVVALFGSARATDLWPRYQPMVSRLVNQGAIELCGQVYEKKYDDVEVFPADGARPTDKAVLAALPPGTAVFGARVKRKGESLGLRYDFFVHRGGRWVTGNQIGKYLVAAP